MRLSEMRDSALWWLAAARCGDLCWWFVLVGLSPIARKWFCCMCCALFAALVFSVRWDAGRKERFLLGADFSGYARCEVPSERR